jgi:hypothetical protein
LDFWNREFSSGGLVSMLTPICGWSKPCCKSATGDHFSFQHGLAGSAISCRLPNNQRHHKMLWACSRHWAHLTGKPIASAIFPREAMMT